MVAAAVGGVRELRLDLVLYFYLLIRVDWIEMGVVIFER